MRAPPSPRIDLDPERIERGLGQLVLTVVELLRRLLEMQALRRIEGGGLTEEQIERLGITLERLAEHMEALKAHFGIEDLDIDLGPLGRLLGDEGPRLRERSEWEHAPVERAFDGGPRLREREHAPVARAFDEGKGGGPWTERDPG